MFLIVQPFPSASCSTTNSANCGLVPLLNRVDSILALQAMGLKIDAYALLEQVNECIMITRIHLLVRVDRCSCVGDAETRTRVFTLARATFVLCSFLIVCIRTSKISNWTYLHTRLSFEDDSSRWGLTHLFTFKDIVVSTSCYSCKEAHVLARRARVLQVLTISSIKLSTRRPS